MEDLHIYLFVLIAIVISMYMVGFVSPSTSAYGESGMHATGVPQGGIIEKEIVVIQNVTEKNFSSNF